MVENRRRKNKKEMKKVSARIVSVLSLVYLIMFPVGARANYSFLGNIQKVERIESGLLLTCQNNNLLKIRFQKPGMFRVTLGRNGVFLPTLTYPIYKTQWEPVALQVNENADHLQIQSAALQLIISKIPCRLMVLDTAGRIINRDDPAFGIGWDGAEVRCWKTISPDEKFFGLGEKTGNLNKRGVQWEMWNSDVPGYGANHDPIYQSIPFFIGMRENRAYGIYFNNSYRSYFNMGAGNLRYYSFSAIKGNLDYFFIYGPQVRKVVRDYTELTGRTPMWPRWALGYQQCRWSYYPESEVLRLAETFRDKLIPADVIYLDIHYMDGYRVFTWDKNRFPDPAGMLERLRKMGFRVVVIIDPGVKADSSYFVAKQGIAGNHFLKYPDGEVFRGEVWPGVSYFPDFSRAATVKWWGGLFAGLLGEGIAGFWNDMNEPAVWGRAFPEEVIFDDDGLHSSQKKMHNLYGFLMAKAAYEGNRSLRPNQRPFIITRAGFAGEQRFTTVWTGDNVASEEHLALGIRMLQGLGLSGVSFAGMDVGGFIGHPRPELFARWMQVGSVTPFFRTHTHYGSEDQEPWSFGEEIEKINRKTLRWRYRLIPYLYSLLWESHRSGAPIVRPMFWQFQQDERCYGWDTQQQFLLGRNVLIAPVTRENQYLRKLYLPEGKWIDLAQNKVYNGPADIIVDAPLEELPVFLKAGGILPLWNEMVQWSSQKAMEKLTLLVFPRDSGSVALYEDDGETMDYLRGKYRLSRFTILPLHDGFQVKREIIHNEFTGSIKEFTLRILNVKSLPGGINLNGKKFTLDNFHRSYYIHFDKTKKELMVKVPSTKFKNISFL